MRRIARYSRSTASTAKMPVSMLWNSQYRLPGDDKERVDLDVE
jgi:hypothetical protein